MLTAEHARSSLMVVEELKAVTRLSAGIGTIDMTSHRSRARRFCHKGSFGLREGIFTSLGLAAEREAAIAMPTIPEIARASRYKTVRGRRADNKILRFHNASTAAAVPNATSSAGTHPKPSSESAKILAERETCSTVTASLSSACDSPLIHRVLAFSEMPGSPGKRTARS